MKAFSTYHPLVLFVYFVAVIGFTMFYNHPIYLCISFTGAFILSVTLNGKKTLKNHLFFYLPMFLIIALSNPMFCHKGMTVLLYVDDNPITLESIVYGMVMAGMIISMVFWFTCYNAVMTSDKFIYLFGKVVPSIALIISMTLRLVPKFNTQIKLISNSQKTIGMDCSCGNMFQKIKNGIRIISILMTWALENAIDTADSMKARGYGLKGRSTFSLFTFEKRDGLMLAFILTLVGVNIIGNLFGYCYYSYYPMFTYIDLSSIGILFYVSYAVLMIIPVVVEVKEEIKWHLLILKI